MADLSRAVASPRIFRTFPWLLASLLLMSGCATVIPETDSDPPEIALTLSGGGLGSQQMSNPPRIDWKAPAGAPYLNLEGGVRYRFILSVSDEGGVRRAHLRIPEDAEITDLTPENTQKSPWSPWRVLELRGDRSDPRTDLVITGTVVFPSGTGFLEFEAEADDFGGRRERVNQTFMFVSAFVD